MKSEQEITEFLGKLKEIKTVIHPSVIKFAEWVLDKGDPKEEKIWLEIMNGIIDAYKRKNETK